MRLLTVVVAAITLLCSFACMPESKSEDWRPTDSAGPRELKPYDPQKAGATIVDSFDLTNNSFVNIDKFSPPKIKGYYMAEYNGHIYIMDDEKIFIFDKKTLQKKSEIKIIFPNYSGYSYNHGFAIINDNKAIFIKRFEDYENPATYSLCSIDLSTGNVEIINAGNIIGFNWEHDCLYPEIGFDKKDDSLWILLIMIDENNNFFCYCKYDDFAQTFLFSEKKEGFYTRISSHPYFEEPSYNGTSVGYIFGISIYGNESWNTIFFQHRMAGGILAVRLEKRHLDNPTEVVQFIDVEYLGTLSIPGSIIYDPPYIWMLAEKDNKVLMLKLLPNE
jgi:hypothetical protein